MYVSITDIILGYITHHIAVIYCHLACICCSKHLIQTLPNPHSQNQNPQCSSALDWISERHSVLGKQSAFLPTQERKQFTNYY